MPQPYGSAPAGTTYRDSYGAVSIVADMLDRRGDITGDPKRASILLLHLGLMVVPLQIKPADRIRIELAAGQA